MRSHLPRLPEEFYQGHAYVHWTHTVDGRRRGWLNREFHNAFREFLIHAGARYDVAFPVYCLMPDHFHMLCMGLRDHSDQRKAMRFVRKEVNRKLASAGATLQRQPHDNILRERDRERDAFESLAYYILNNPARAGLVPDDDLLSYTYSGSIFPRYPNLDHRADDHWDRFWRIYRHDQEHHAT